MKFNEPERRDTPKSPAVCGPAPSNGSLRVDVYLTQSDLAALIGATRERVSRALSAFRASGTIAWDKDTGHWIICHSALLAKRAEM